MLDPYEVFYSFLPTTFCPCPCILKQPFLYRWKKNIGNNIKVTWNSPEWHGNKVKMLHAYLVFIIVYECYCSIDSGSNHDFLCVICSEMESYNMQTAKRRWRSIVLYLYKIYIEEQILLKENVIKQWYNDKKEHYMHVECVCLVVLWQNWR